MFYVLITFVYKQAELNYLCFMFVIIKEKMGGFFEDCMELRERKEKNEKFRVSVDFPHTTECIRLGEK